ncbi:ABC transporter permease subunit [Streptomyces alkaliphilus]|uniref:ABC transporter permease subunit n=1 Tax=Streptomyces alkaliphilus TaxID=1472722 RepID=A0A7W3T9H6_9ACTN|nr:ABC transporter permease [Streptomyces alkaliphilus]MBB0242749.1 ABC transporter permease subunit [Streptomyces alkaliphilus]
MSHPSPAPPRTTRRRSASVDLAIAAACVGALLLAIVVTAWLLDESSLRSHAGARLMPPGPDHLFGTDWLGRDLFTRTIMGLRLSLTVGVVTALLSVAVATVLGIAAALLGGWVDAVISWLIDLSIGIPHLVFMVLVAFSVGGGIKGIVIGISLTHWMSLARLIRADVLHLRHSDFVLASRGFGRSEWFIARRHLFGQVLPQALVGFVLMFPHVVLHEAALTFLGFGFSPQTPAIGILLHEGMPHISSGMWWMALFPGLCLLLVVLAFARLGDRLRVLTSSPGQGG